MKLGFIGSNKGLSPEQILDCTNLLKETRPSIVYCGDTLSDFHFQSVINERCKNVPIDKSEEPVLKNRVKQYIDLCDVIAVAVDSNRQKTSSDVWNAANQIRKTGKTLIIMYPEAD